MKQTLRLAFCGVVTGLSVAVMLLSALVPVATYALPGLAGILSIALVVEFGIGWALPAYAATALVSLFLVPDKETALVYLLFAGYYPIVKALIERVPSRVLAYAIKFALFNAAAIGIFFLSVYVLGVPMESFQVFGKYLPWLLLLLGNAAFFAYDFAVSGLVVMYYRRLHPVFEKWFQSPRR